MRGRFLSDAIKVIAVNVAHKQPTNINIMARIHSFGMVETKQRGTFFIIKHVCHRPISTSPPILVTTQSERKNE